MYCIYYLIIIQAFVTGHLLSEGFLKLVTEILPLTFNWLQSPKSWYKISTSISIGKREYSIWL